MGQNTGIQWTDHTWNPWHGCEHVSPGCANCYMFTEKIRYGQSPTTVLRSKTTFNAPLKFPADPDHNKVFTCSWSDWFIKDADAWRPEAWDIIVNACNKNKSGITRRICKKCANRVGLTYNVKSELVAFKLDRK